MTLVNEQDFRAELERQEAYWQSSLGGELAGVRVCADYPRSPVSSFIRASESVDLDARLYREIKNICARENVALFVLLLAAFKTLLLRHTAQEDIIVVSPSSDSIRWMEGKEQQKFTNLLALRTNLAGDPGFLALLERVAKTLQDAASNRDYSFDKVVEHIHSHQEVSFSPIFQAMFAICDIPSTLSAAPITVDNLANVEEHSNKCDVVVLVRVRGETLTVTCQYDAELFESTTIVRLLGHYQVLLEGVVLNPHQRLSELPLLTEAEQHQLLVEWNHTKRDYPKDKCIHQLFEEQVEKSPDAVVVVFENQQLTYSELNQHANQLAHYLRKQGVGPDVLVGICAERSLEMVVGLLGILKAGGAYVPLDPKYPKERLAFMLEDIQTKVLLTQERLITHLPEPSARVVCLDSDWEKIAEQSDENPISSTTAETLAYVIYTSGSTGRPKGVQIPHRGVLRLLFGLEYVQLDVNETFLHLAPTSFDASTFEIWGALLHGAKCVLFPGRVPSPKELGDLLHKREISTLWLTASLFNTVIDEAYEALSGVRQLLIGGEALSVPHVRRALALLPHTQIINGYGPTESTTFTCCYSIPPRLDETINSIPIGRPIGNTQVYILDDHLNPVPVGVPGEIYIGGDGLAQGYFNRSELTAEKFIRNPFSGDSASCLYRTGDRARYLPDGNIEFLGRIDDQVKIRGYRIELGEIEVTLGEHPMVREVVAIAREDTPGDKKLVAYIVLKQATLPMAQELRSFLKKKLPEHMIPSALVSLESLPVTPNGKVDRKALPIPDQSRPELERSFAAPRSLIEELLAQIWAEVLKLEKVGIHDNFFDLGGHSLSATQVISRIRQALEAEVPLRTMFEAPTVAEMAAVIAEYQAEKLKEKDLNCILTELESLADEEVERFLPDETETERRRD